MKRRGRARAPAAGTILNALATGTGAAFAIDRHTEATVELSAEPLDAFDHSTEDRSGSSDSNESSRPAITGEIAGTPDADTRLIERCVELVVEELASPEAEIEYGRIETDSEVAMAAGLKSSSAAANAAVLATLDALDAVADPGEERRESDREPSGTNSRGGGSAASSGAGATDEIDRTHGSGTTEHGLEPPVGRIAACRLGVRAAREVGVTVTGAFDDASASMVGGVTVTENTADRLLAHDTDFERDVLVWTPPERAYSADADVERCRRVAPVAEVVAQCALAGEYERAMTTNGFAYCGALGYSAEPMLEALAEVQGVSLSGTGPSVVAVGDRAALEEVNEDWSDREGNTWLTRTDMNGARVA
jgi:shikimate kinase